MLHHANVDRLIAMWQAIHFNNSTMNTTAAAHGTFGTKPGTMVNADSPLKPFFDSRLNYHTSKTASHTNTFGYTYPEIDDWSKTPEELAAYVTSRVNDLYGQGVSAAPKGRVGQAAAKGYTTTPKLVDYAAEIRVDRSKVPLPCSISLRLGNHVLGVMTLLAMPIRGVSYASIPLRDSLQRLNLKNMPEDALVPYLQRNLAVELREVCPLAVAPSRRRY
jgi:tyrosinase